MLKWFRKTPKLTNKAGLCEEALELLARDLEELREVNRGIPERVLCYIIDGEDAGVLRDLQKSQHAGIKWGLKCIYGLATLEEEPTIRQQFLQKVDVQDPHLYIRLGKALEAAAASCRAQMPNKLLPEWLEALIPEFTIGRPPCGHIETQLTTDTLEKMLQADGKSPELFIRSLLYEDPDYAYRWNAYSYFAASLVGSQDYPAKYEDIVKGILKSKGAAQEAHVLNVLTQMKAPLEPFASEAVNAAFSSSAQVRLAAEHYIKTDPGPAVPFIAKKIFTGKPDPVRRGVQLLISLFGRERTEELLDQHQLRDAIEKAERKSEYNLPVISDEPPAPELELPPAAAVDPVAPLTNDAIRSLKGVFEKCNQELERIGPTGGYYKPNLIPMDLIDHRIKIIQGDSHTKGSYKECAANRLTGYIYGSVQDNLLKGIAEWAGHPDVQLIHIVRLLVMTESISIQGEHGVQFNMWRQPFKRCLKSYEQARGCTVGLRELAEVFAAMDVDRKLLGIGVFRQPRWSGKMRWADEALWPYFVEHLDLIEGALGVKVFPVKVDSSELSELRRSAMEIVTAFPTPPPSLVPALWDFAFGTLATVKPLAIQALDKLPDKKKRLLDAVKNGKPEARATAAMWLARLDERDAIPVIQAALKKEKQETVKVSLMNALETLGVPLEKIIDKEQMLKDAQAGIKNIPDSLSWFPFDALPRVRLQNGEEVPREILIWRIIQHHKLNNPEPGTMLVRYCSLFRADDREALGRLVLESWIAQDTKMKYTQREVEQKAKQIADYQVKHYPQYCTYDSAYRRAYNELINEVEGSAIKEKGILAIAAACGGGYTTPIVEKYLKRWYGLRMAQCKALIRMLLWVEHDTAIQLLLSVANRFRTKGIQEEAAACVQALAERKGWTVEQLADKTIPTAGFDENREMVLDYGSRTFTAKIDTNFDITIYTEDGSTVKSLPEASKADDPDKAKEAKKQLSDAKKELKQVLKAQKERLYEAMCTQRTWSLEDWSTYIYGHPIVRSYCQSLVWSAVEGDKEVRFRPLDDGTFTDYQDNDVKLSESVSIKLAHSCNTPEDEGKAWLKHLKDYEIEPIFEQFTKPVYALPEDREKQMEIDGFQGYMVDHRKFRNRAEKFGYVHSQAEDGGNFYYHMKKFPSLGIQAVIESTAICIAINEGHPPVALKSLNFVKLSEDTEGNFPNDDVVPLGEVPPVLLSECYNELATIASEGSGFDADWEKKTW